jgi:HAD superfamily hydrolase (TIGR01509 family)
MNKEKMKIKGLIFDFDGLIVDTEIPEFNSWQNIFHSYGTELDFLDWAKSIGTSFEAFNVVKNLMDKSGCSLEPDEIRFRQKTLSDAIVDNQPALPGVISTLEFAQDNNLKLAIASSSSFDWVEKHLKRLNIIDKFECILTSDNVKEVKPAPDLYLSALDQLGLNSMEVIAFEDSPNGIRAARDAGIFCVAIPNALTRLLDLSYANLVVDSFENIQFSSLIRHINQYWNRNS